MQLGLADQERCPRLQGIPQLLEQPLEILDFMHHPKRDRETETGAGCDPKVIDLGLHQLDALEELVSFQPPLCHRQHARLEVDCDDFALTPDETRQPLRVEPRPAPDIENPHASVNPWREDLLRIVKPPPDRIVEASNEPPGAYVTHGSYSSAPAVACLVRGAERIVCGFSGWGAEFAPIRRALPHDRDCSCWHTACRQTSPSEGGRHA